MGDLKTMISNFQKIVADLPNTRQELAKQMAFDAHGLTAHRIQNSGVNARGEKMPLYSKNPLPLFFFDDAGNKRSPSKLASFKKNAMAGKNNGSYDAFRKHFGNPTDRRDLTFTGDMWKSIIIEVDEHDKDKTVVSVRSNSRANQDIVNYNSKRVKSNILAFGKDEKELIKKLNNKRIEKLLNK
jgi:hypothetical protein